MQLEDLSTLCLLDVESLLKHFDSSTHGLSDASVVKLSSQKKKDKKTHLFIPSALFLFFRQFFSPLILLLIGCSLGAFFLSDSLDSIIILSIVLMSALLGFYQESKANHSLNKLIGFVKIKILTLRNGQEKYLYPENLLIGDLVLIQAGDVIPADAILIESNQLFINESILTGESLPIEKFFFSKKVEERVVYMGSHVISGYGKALVCHNQQRSLFGSISEKLKQKQAPTSFEKGITKLGLILIQATFFLVLVIFGINMIYKRPFLDSFLFSLALGIGLTPQLLPMIISVNLSQGASHLARKKVIVKKLNSIENFGSMTILCADKTGTLTEGIMKVESFCNIEKSLSLKTLHYASVNAYFQSGLKNPIDEAILNEKINIDSSWKKLDELPFDFSSKRVSLLLDNQKEKILIVKGALTKVLSLCSFAEDSHGALKSIKEFNNQASEILESNSEKLIKLIGVAYKVLDKDHCFSREDETSLIFLGYLEILDPIKNKAKEELDELKKLGVQTKIISGDHFAIVRQIGKRLGIDENILRGEDLKKLSSSELETVVEKFSLFAEVDPIDKDKIVTALQQKGHVVGFLGDGINDCVAMKRSDVSISVDTAANVAKESADLIMLSHSLSVLKEGILSGRKTFANTLKYIFMATSANFGNMFSMAFSSLILPFIPFLPKQILLINFLTDIPELTISSDKVDQDWLISPQQWNFSFLKKFMIVFGLISSIFDFITFFLFKWMAKSESEFRTAWFLESVISAALVLLVIRTKKSIFACLPSPALATAVISTILITIVIPYTSIGSLFLFTPLSPIFISIIFLIVICYMFVAEAAKTPFYRNR